MTDFAMPPNDRLRQAIQRRLAAPNGRRATALQTAASVTSAIRPEGSAADTLVIRLGGTEEGQPACFVHTGAGGITVYQHLAELLGKHLRLYGLASREDPTTAEAEYQSFDALAASRASALLNLSRSGRLVLIGWSLGGVLAHAVAAHLERMGAAVRLVALLDSQIPSNARALADAASGDSAAAAVLDAALQSQAVAGLHGDRLARARRRLTQSVRLSAEHIPGRLRARLLCVRALQGGTFDQTVAMWRGTASGGFDTSSVNCGHPDLLTGGHAEQTAQAVLRSIESSMKSPIFSRKGAGQ